MKKTIFLSLFYLLCISSLQAQPISSAWTWTDFDDIAGYDGTKPDSDHDDCTDFINLCNNSTVNIPNVGINGTTYTVSSNQVNLALNHLALSYDPDVLQVLYFRPGTYLISNTINLTPSHRNIILRGRGSNNTTLRFTGSSSDFITIAGGLTGNTTSCWGSNSGTALYMSNTNHSFGVNQGAIPEYGKVWRNLVNNADCGNSAGNMYNGQIVRISGVTNSRTAVLIPHRLRQSYYNVNARVREINPAFNNGIECMRIDGSQAGGTIGQNANITFSYAVNCWVQGVESYKPLAQHVKVFNSSNLEVSGCYFHEAQDYGSGGHGYGVNLSNATGECLVANNIFRKLRHSLVLQVGANGNAIAYNYSREAKTFRDDWFIHGRWPHRNLLEGNVVETIVFDRYHGRSGDYNVIFRNRTYKSKIKVSGGNQTNESCSANTNKVAIVGNNVDNNISVSSQTSGHTIYDNQKNGNNHSNGYGNNSSNAAIGNSLLFPSRPSWFPSNQGSWPAVGPGSGGANMIPALYRWNNYNVKTAGGDCTGCIPPPALSINYAIDPCFEYPWGPTIPGHITLNILGGTPPYQNTVWSSLGNSPSLGSTSNTSATFFGPGAYQAQVTDNAGTIKTVLIVVQFCESEGPFKNAPTELEESEKPFSAQIVPNPSQERARLQFYLPEAALLDISLFALNGEKIQAIKSQSTYNAGQHEVDLLVRQLSSGMYFCRIVHGDEVTVVKLIKQ